MKGYQIAGRSAALISIILAVALPVRAQQNNTLFFMHSLPEANYLNPAIQIECGIFIGLPLVSSFHMNFANSGFTAGKAITLYTDGSVRRKPSLHIPAFPGKKYFLSEFHSVLFAAGIKRNEYYYSFTVTEKNNTHVGYTPDLIDFVYDGSDQFEGQLLSLNGTRASLSHLREYAFGVSKEYSTRLTVGIKAKLLFGKFNFNTGNSSFGLFIEQGTQNILFDLEGGYNSSIPWGLEERAPGVYRFDELYEASLISRLMNRQNPGLAFDVGIIFKYDDRWTFSGSLLDVGFIRYRSNLGNYTIEGEESYTGPFGQGQVTDAYLWDVFDEWNLNMNESLTADPYFYFLDPRMYLGATRNLNNRYNLNFLLYNRLLPGKLQTGVTISLLTNPEKAFQATTSWSYMNGSFLNLGAGFRYGRRPVQIYAVSDNILGFILPLSAKNVNLRMGLNLNFGCNKTITNINDPGCSWISEKRIKKERVKREKVRL
jgi:hypothetical protein